jgi:hypothetical protein
MPRPPRLQAPGAAYHISARAVAGRALYRTEDDWNGFLKLLTRVMVERDWVCGAYCLLTTHYHLLVRTPEADLASGMQEINSCYAQEFNRRYGSKGMSSFGVITRPWSSTKGTCWRLVVTCRVTRSGRASAGERKTGLGVAMRRFSACACRHHFCLWAGCSSSSVAIFVGLGPAIARSLRTCPERPRDVERSSRGLTPERATAVARRERACGGARRAA